MKLMGSGHTAAVARATSYFSDTSYYNDMTGGIGYFKFLEDCAKNFDEKKSEIIAGLKRVMEALFTRENMTVSYTADDEGFSYLGNAMKKLSEKLPAGSGKILSVYGTEGEFKRGIYFHPQRSTMWHTVEPSREADIPTQARFGS